MQAPFRAVIIDQTADGFQMGVQHLEQHDLPPGDVLIQVAYAALNYKDALVCIPNGNVAGTYPLVPGLELTGEVGTPGMAQCYSNWRDITGSSRVWHGAAMACG